MEEMKDRLRRLRKAAGLTQAQLARAAGVSQGTIGNIESGLRGYGESLVDIAKALNVPAEYLRGEVHTLLPSLNGTLAPLTGFLIAGPAIPPGTPMTTRTITEEQWQLLQDVDMLIEEDREAIRKTIKEKADYARRVWEEMVRRSANGGSGNA